MTTEPPLSALLSQALVAFTIEFDNEFEHRMPHTTARGPAAHSGHGPWLVSTAMWSNFMRYLGADGVPVTEMDMPARLTNLPGLIRWRYVEVVDGLIRPTLAGRRAQQLWGPLTSEIEQRWQLRFGPDTVAPLRDGPIALIGQFERALPRYLPVIWTGKSEGRLDGWPPGVVTGQVDQEKPELPELLAQVLLMFAIEAERLTALSLPISANALRVATPDGVRMKDLPLIAGVSKEAISMSVKFLTTHDLLVIEPDPAAARGQIVRLTARGRTAQQEHRQVLAQVEQSWQQRYGVEDIGRLRAALRTVLEHPRSADGLRPYPDGWRAHPPYRALTAALLRDPLAGLPRFPMVLHRGGFPDGS